MNSAGTDDEDNNSNVVDKAWPFSIGLCWWLLQSLSSPKRQFSQQPFSDRFSCHGRKHSQTVSQWKFSLKYWQQALAWLMSFVKVWLRVIFVVTGNSPSGSTSLHEGIACKNVANPKILVTVSLVLLVFS